MAEDRQRRLRCKLALPGYLSELRELTGREIEPSELGSPDDVAAARERWSQNRRNHPLVRLDMPFTELRGTQWAAVVNRLTAQMDGPVQIWLLRSNDCGLLTLPSLGLVHFDFPFDIDSNGVVGLHSAETDDGLTIDLVDEGRGQRAEITLRGTLWPDAALGAGEEWALGPGAGWVSGPSAEGGPM